MCPRFPEPVPLEHPISALKEALEKIDILLRLSIHDTRLPSLYAIVVFYDSALWNGNFGRRNGSDPSSPPTNEYTLYRIASLSNIFPTLMLYKLWEEGNVVSLDGPLEKYAANFTITNLLGKRRDVVEAAGRYVTTATWPFPYWLTSAEAGPGGADGRGEATSSGQGPVPAGRTLPPLFYELKAGLDWVLVMQQLDPTVPAKYSTIRLDFLQERVFRVVFDGECPCKLKVNSMSLSLESQDRQLVNYYNFKQEGRFIWIRLPWTQRLQSAPDSSPANLQQLITEH
ncbi:unnamed protein product [Coregonus sp. 'balchen']|nr:unnamed protein product [Coregonus sp. 'balchen']